jgi:hypothetical protein
MVTDLARWRHRSPTRTVNPHFCGYGYSGVMISNLVIVLVLVLEYPISNTQYPTFK